MGARLAELIGANVWKVIKGHYGSWLGLVAAGAILTVSVLGGALLVPNWRPVAILVALANLVLTALVIVALIARSNGQLLDVAANVSLQSHLARAEIGRASCRERV